MSATSYAWVVLAFPLAGMLVCAFGYRRLPGHSAGWIASLSILGSFVASILMLLQLQDLPAEERALVDSAFTYFKTAGMTVDLSILVDPLSVFMCLVVSGISFFIHVYSIGYMDGDEGFVRYFAYLNYFVFSMLLLVLAANFVILIVGWAFVGAASYLLISFWYRRTTATRAGIKAFVINVIGDVGPGDRHLPAVQRHRRAGLRGGLLGRRQRVHHQRRPVGGRLPDAAGRRLREVGPAPPAHLAARRHGGPHAGLLPDPRGHDGHRGRVPDRAHVPAVRAGPAGRRHQRGDRHGDAAVRRHGRGGGDRPQTRDRLLHDLADRLHDPGRLDRRPTARGCSTS